MRKMPRPWLWLAALAMFLGQAISCGAEDYRELPTSGWAGKMTKAEGLDGERVAVIAYPKKDASQAAYTSSAMFPPGLYRLRLTLCPSQTKDISAWMGGLNLTVENGQVLHPIEWSGLPDTGTGVVTPVEWRGIEFQRSHGQETKEIDIVLAKEGQIHFVLESATDARSFEAATMQAAPKAGTEVITEAVLGDDEPRKDEGGESTLVDSISPRTHFYYLVDKAEIKRLSSSARVEEVAIDKLRYVPGEAIAGQVTLLNLGKAAATGKLRLRFEHELGSAEEAKTIEVLLDSSTQSISFSLPCPQGEFGQALVAEYTSADGKDSSSAATYFNITDDYHRIAIYCSNIGNAFRLSYLDEPKLRERFAAIKATYANSLEFFSWGADDMVGLSPENDYWFSGQSAYFVKKKGLQDAIRVAHENGIAMITYGKFAMSGYLGWKEAYDRPFDHKNQCRTSMGMAVDCGANIPTLDRFKYGEILPASLAGDSLLNGNWGGCYVFLPIYPDDTPRNVRAAAEAMIKSVEMFGWDGVRWDGHPRGGNLYANACGGGNVEGYSREQSQKTQFLVRYFKDIVNARYPKFRHGYNYLFIQEKPNTGWAVEDYELDELCQGGGMLMNESIGKTPGKTFGWLAKNLQAEGDLARERNAHALCMSNKGTERDTLLETCLYFAAGIHPMAAAANNRILNRYATRYSSLVFDEHRRRLEKPEELLKPLAKTSLWWEPFVYEKASNDGASLLIVNLLNIDPNAKIEGIDKFKKAWEILPASEPVEFSLSLPAPRQLKQALLIDPFSLSMEKLEEKAGKLTLPAVKLWKVLVLEIEAPAGMPALAESLGPVRTFGLKRDIATGASVAKDNAELRQLMNPKAADEAPAGQVSANAEKAQGQKVAQQPQPLDIKLTNAEAAKAACQYFPEPESDWWREAPELANMSETERNKVLLARIKSLADIRASVDAKSLLAADLAMNGKRPLSGSSELERNSALDVYYVRGVMDYNLRFHEGLARIPRFNFQEAWLGSGGLEGEILAGGGMLGKDVLVFVDIPHAAIGVENSYAMLEYIKAGGGVLFTGGEYSFGKGLYQYTILDRELLPVVCAANMDVRYAPEPLALEAGPDFGELKASVDWSVKPRVWCWNEVALRPGADVKVFLKAGNRPMLVGWQLGKGRVACLLANHRGRGGKDTPAFFDWQGWPVITAKVLQWLAPEAETEKRIPPKAIPDEEIKRLKGKQSELADVLVEDAGQNEDGNSLADDKGVARAQELPASELAERMEFIQSLLKAEGATATGLLAEQLTIVSNFPEGLRFAMVDFIAQAPPKNLSDCAELCLRDKDLRVRNIGLLLAALGKPEALRQQLLIKPSAMDGDQINRRRYLSLATAYCSSEILKDIAEKQVREMNKVEADGRAACAKNTAFSEMADMMPALDSEDIFARLGWLSYLAQICPKQYAAQFAAEWAMIPQYQDFCGRTAFMATCGLANLKSGSQPSEANRMRERIAECRHFKSVIGQMGRATQPKMEALLKRNPQDAIQGLTDIRYSLAARQAINLLGRFTPAETRDILEKLCQARQQDLAAFATARLSENTGK